MRPHINFKPGSGHITAYDVNIGLIAYNCRQPAANHLSKLLSRTSRHNIDKYIDNLTLFDAKNLDMFYNAVPNLQNKIPKNCTICENSPPLYVAEGYPVCANCINFVKLIKISNSHINVQLNNDYIKAIYYSMIVTHYRHDVYKMTNLKDCFAIEPPASSHLPCQFSLICYQDGKLCQYCHSLTQQHKQICIQKYIYLRMWTIKDIAQSIYKMMDLITI